jgi:hypothetical protein
MRTDAYRSAAYNAKVTPTTVGLKIAARLPGMKSTFSTGMSALHAHQAEVAAILDADGIVGVLRGRYHAFGNRLHKITKNFNGPVATAEAQAEFEKWVLSCTDTTLIKIALDVYSLTVA